MASYPDAARRASLRDRVAASREIQGLPPYVEDEVVLERIVQLFTVFRDRPRKERRE